MTNFQDNLLSDLMVSHGSELTIAGRPQARRSARHPRRIAAGALALAAAAAVGITTLGNSPAAYAVTKNPNGTVTVSISDIQAIGPANAELQALGVRAKAVPMTSDCASLEGQATYMGPFSLPIEEGDSITLGPNIPAGYTVLITVSDSPGRGTGFGFTAPVKDPAPSCVLDPAADPAERSNP
jgi:hypothetical protein